MYVDFRLPERLQAKIRTGQTAQVAFDALPGVRYSAVVQAINPQIDADGRSVAVRGCIDNRRLQLRPGMFARVTTVFSERANAQVIPEEAVVPDGASPYVFKVVEGQQAGSRVARRTPVKLGARAPGFVEVVEGLRTGDLVVSAGQQRIQKDGAAVRVVELGQSASAPTPTATSSASAASAAAAVDVPAPVASAAVAAGGAGAAVAAAPASAALVAPPPGANPCLAAALPAGRGANAAVRAPS